MASFGVSFSSVKKPSFRAAELSTFATSFSFSPSTAFIGRGFSFRYKTVLAVAVLARTAARMNSRLLRYVFLSVISLDLIFSDIPCSLTLDPYYLFLGLLNNLRMGEVFGCLAGDSTMSMGFASKVCIETIRAFGLLVSLLRLSRRRSRLDPSTNDSRLRDRVKAARCCLCASRNISTNSFDDLSYDAGCMSF